MTNFDINSQIKNEFIVKSRAAALGFTLIALIFALFVNLDGIEGMFARFLGFAIFALNLYRFFIAYKFLKNPTHLSFVITKIEWVVLLNAMLWVIFSFVILIANDFQLNYYTLTLFLTLSSFAIGLLSNLYWNKFLLFFSVISFNLPIIAYSIYQTIVDHVWGRLVIAFLFIINIAYIYIQSKVMLKDTINRIVYSEDLKNSIAEIDRTNKALERETFNKLQASKMASLVDFASGIAHEVNNPLTIVQITNNKFLDKEFGQITELQEEKLNKMRVAIERIDKVIASLKNVTNNIAFEEFTENKLDVIIDSVLEIYHEKAILYNVKIECDPIPNINVLCIAPQISQIVINLLDNAIEATSNLGTGGKINIQFNQSENFAMMRIINNGPLVSPENIDKLFIPFYTTKEIGRGPGLGLTLSKSLANGNGGSLEYEEYEGHVSFLLKIKKSI